MKTANTNPVIKSVELPNRVKLQYVEQGDPTGVPLLLLHGITDSWHSYERVLPHLPTHLHAFALSQRGHGDADRPLAGYHPRDFAADLKAFMDTLKLRPAVIAGHSMSSVIAQRFALDYPECTRGIVLIGSFITLRGNPGVSDLWDVVSKLRDPIDPRFALEFQQSTLARAVPQVFLETVVKESLKVPARVWRAALETLMEIDHSGDLYKIEAPALIVWGDQDSLCPCSAQESLRAAITGSRLVVYQGTGHAPHWEEPERFAADLVAFTESLIK
jgi:Predicted hydrolases or acyltransferases (alpha/beta hydrolase superfamily)